MTIRKATIADIPQMQVIFAEAKKKMRASGNTKQWDGGYPSDEVLRRDIEKGWSHIIEINGSAVATFALLDCPEPTYAKIYEGKWIDDITPYVTIHRIASKEGVHGILSLVLDYVEKDQKNKCIIRIDTHRDNLPMRHLLEKNDFAYCGIIYLESGDERLAFQRV